MIACSRFEGWVARYVGVRTGRLPVVRSSTDPVVRRPCTPGNETEVRPRTAFMATEATSAPCRLEDRLPEGRTAPRAEPSPPKRCGRYRAVRDQLLRIVDRHGDGSPQEGLAVRRARGSV